MDGLWGMYQWLDRAPKGRNETGIWWRRHDEYDEPERPQACAPGTHSMRESLTLAAAFILHLAAKGPAVGW